MDTDASVINEKKTSEKDLLSIVNNYVFIRIFSMKNILANFLSDYFGFTIKPDEIEIENPILGPFKNFDKVSIPDLKLKIILNAKEYWHVDIEMQTSVHRNLWKRFQFYQSRMCGDQLISGEEYHLLEKVFVLVIFSVNFIKDAKCHHKFTLYDRENEIGYNYSNEIHFLEIEKREELLELKTSRNAKKVKLLFKWLKFFASKTREEFMEAAQGNAAMELAWQTLEKISQDSEERRSAEAVDRELGEYAARYNAGYLDGLEAMERMIAQEREKIAQECEQEIAQRAQEWEQKIAQMEKEMC